jgi:glutamate--cysteine ligase
MSPSTRDAWIAALSDRFSASFPATPRALRTLGRESEFPIVHPDGTGADITPLWARLAEGQPGASWSREGSLVTGLDLPGVSYSSEVGRGTMEIIVGPCDDLLQVQAASSVALERLVRAAEAEGLAVLGYGIQPVTPGTPDWMTAKKRYRALLDVLGETWLWFTLTASDQAHVSVGRGEALAITSLTNLLSPLIIGLCANSPVFEGRPSGFCSAREATMGRIHAGNHRHGMPAGPTPDAASWVGRTFPMDYLMHKVGDEVQPVGRPFGAWLEEQGDLPLDDAFRAWVWHDHYVWNSARPRTAHGTVELRSACQQPGHEQLAVSALSTGLVCGWEAIAARVERTFGDAAWPTMRGWHAAVVRDGLAAPEPAAGFVDGVLADAAEALEARGRGEAALMAPLFARWARRENPAQAALAAFQAGGVAGLVQHTQIR